MSDRAQWGTAVSIAGTKPCENCGDEYGLPAGVSLRGFAARRYCSLACSLEARACDVAPLELDGLAETDYAWAAGFFDGEGCISITGRSSPRLDISQKDRRALDRFHGIVGVGKVVDPSRLPSRLKNPVHRYYLGGFWNVATVMLALWPYLGPVKREQAQRAFDRYFEVRGGGGH